MSNPLTQLAEFISAATFSQLPTALAAQAKRHILDTFGAALAGADSDIWRVAQGMAAAEQGAAQAAAWGSPLLTSARNAAWLNGVAAHMYELDDTGGCDHSGAVVLPAAMAIVPHCAGPVSGEALITATVIGYDVGRRVLEACGGYSPHNGAGWHSTATCGVFGAAAAAASLLRLDARQCASALGIAASFSGGLWAFIHDGSQSKKLHAGRAAEGGVLAALLASQGITGPGRIFDDCWGGFLTTFARDSADVAALTAGLGEVWKLARCSVKPYASCRGTHAAIDALGLLMAEQRLQAEDIAAVRVHLNPFLQGMCGGRDIDSLAAAQMSLPYALAARACFGQVGLDEFDERLRHSRAVGQMLARIELRLDDAQGNDDEPTVEVITRSGDSLRRHVPVALGSPRNPLSDEALQAKFRRLAQRAIPAEQAQRLLDACLTLERCVDVRTLSTLLAAAG